MPAPQYITAPESDYSQGIDSRSAENQIDPTFVRDLLNADVIGKRARKRKGYQGYSGNIPFRVTSLEYTNSTNQICFTLDSAVELSDTTVDLTSARSSPIVVYGRSSSISSGGPFTTSGDTARYYSGFTVPTRKTLLATAGAPPYESLTVPSEEHGISTTNTFMALVEATSTADKSYQTGLPHELYIDESSYDMTVEYQNSTSTNKEAYVYYRDRDTVAGQSYVSSLSHTGSGSETFTITSATHGLDSFNIIAQVQRDLGTTRTQVLSEIVITSSGDVQITIHSTTAATFWILLSAASVSNFASGNVSAGATDTITLSGLESPWIFYGIYLELTPGGNRQLVYPDLVEYDDSNGSAVLTFVNGTSSACNFVVFYEYGVIRSNRICVTDVSLTTDATDSRPQLTIWGLDHADIYGAEPSGRSGWVTHLDSYKSAGERRLVAGLGGNLFSSRTYDEAASTYLYPLLYPRLQARTSAARVLGPLLWDTGDTPSRTRGYITANESGTGWAKVTSVEYDSSTDYTVFTLSLPGKAILDSSGTPTTLSSVLSTTSGLEDYLTVQDMSYARHNGTWKIRQAVDGVDHIALHCEVDGNSEDYDDTATYGEAGVFTDQIVWLSASPFVPGDVLLNAAFGDTFVCTVLSSSSTTSVIDGIVDRIDISGGLVTPARRTSSVIPTRDAQPSAAATTENLVRGDMLSYSGYDYLNMLDQVERLLRVQGVHADSDRTVGITSDGETAVVTLGSGDTSYLGVGRKVLLLQAGIYTGVQTVTAITGTSTWEFATSESGIVVGATLAGHTMEVDEELQWEDASGDSVSLWVERRWIPVEAPDDSYGLTPSTYVRHFDSAAYGAQDFLRSVMVQDTLYLTNYADEVLKFDGTSIYRTGLLPWQPGLFLTQDTAASARIVVDCRSISYSARSAVKGQLTITASDEGVVPVGTSVRLSGSTGTYTIREYRNDGTNYYVYMDRALDSGVSASGTAAEIAIRRYYFRLNAVDANDNIVASAVTGYQDHVVELTTDAAVQIRLVGLPAWDNYDYDRLEVEIYATRTRTVAPFYKVTTIQMDFDNGQGYLTFTDSLADSDLIDLDVVSTALKGTELGTAWQEPLRSKYITSLGNSLVLANVKDYPQLDIQVIASGAVGNATFAGKRFLFRRSNTDTGTTTNMLDRVAYEFVNGTTGTASAHAIGTNEFSFTTSTVTGAVAGDWIYLTYATVATTGRDLSYCGWWQIETAVGTTVTVNLPGAVAAGSYPNRYVIATDPTDVPVLLGTDGNLGMVNGDSFDLFDLMRRLSMALNGSMRMVDTSLSAYESFRPWLTARGGNDVGKAGRLVVRRPRADAETLEVVMPSSFSGAGASFDVFVNDIRRTVSQEVSAVARIYPSRILVSYENYPEIFDSPTSVLDTESASAIDVNSADGQEITGIIPFFGESAFGASQQSGVLAVIKSHSIYLVDINEKRAGRNPIQRIESDGQGCTAPYSIAVTKDGIVFANESGIYCLRRNARVDYIGEYMERNWTDRVDADLLSVVQGHHHGLGHTYKISVPLVGDTSPSEVYVYNHTGETGNKYGAWSRYDNCRTTGWANLDSDEFHCTPSGRVMSTRRLGTIDDYRDDNSAVTFRLDTRALDFGNAGIRKILAAVIAYYRTLTTSEGTTVSFSVDLEQEYTESTPVSIEKRRVSSGVGDTVGKDIVGIAHETGRRRGTHFSIRIENASIDENLEIAGLEFRVAGLSNRGILQAAQTTEES